jgi:hypothetical protein
MLLLLTGVTQPTALGTLNELGKLAASTLLKELK